MNISSHSAFGFLQFLLIYGVHLHHYFLHRPNILGKIHLSDFKNYVFSHLLSDSNYKVFK